MWSPHVAAHETHQRSLEFLFFTQKRLFQHYRHLTDVGVSRMSALRQKRSVENRRLGRQRDARAKGLAEPFAPALRRRSHASQQAQGTIVPAYWLTNTYQTAKG